MMNSLILLLTNDFNSTPNIGNNIIPNYKPELIHATIKHFSDKAFRIIDLNNETIQQLEKNVEYEVLSRIPKFDSSYNIGDDYEESSISPIAVQLETLKYVLDELLFRHFNEYYSKITETDFRACQYMSKALFNLENYFPTIELNETNARNIYFDSFSIIKTLKPNDFIRIILKIFLKYYLDEEICNNFRRILLNFDETPVGNTNSINDYDQTFPFSNEEIDIELLSFLYERKFLKKYSEFNESNECTGEYTYFFVRTISKYSEIISRLQSFLEI